MNHLTCVCADSSVHAQGLSEVSRRVHSIRPSKTMAITDKAQSMKEDGVRVIGLAAGEPDFDTPAPICDAAVAAIQAGRTRYTPNTGTSSLKHLICAKLSKENGLEYGEDCIVLSNGAKQSIAQAILATCDPGDEVIVPAPYWVSYPEMVTLAGAESVIVPTKVENDFLLTPEELTASITERSRVLILCSPSNPTGAVYPLERLQALADVVSQHPRLLVISDEIYEHIIYAPAEHHSFGALPGMFDRTLTVNGFSKCFAMTGWRLGYLAAPAHFASGAAKIQSQLTSGASSVAQAAGECALQLGPNGGEPVQRMVAAYKERRDFMMGALQAIPKVRVAEPRGAFYVFPNVEAYFGAGMTAEGFEGEISSVSRLCEYLLETAGVALVPGDAFGEPQCLRISYATSLSVLQEAMGSIASALSRIQRQ